jgi:hypothetical protein
MTSVLLVATEDIEYFPQEVEFHIIVVGGADCGFHLHMFLVRTFSSLSYSQLRASVMGALCERFTFAHVSILENILIATRFTEKSYL